MLRKREFEANGVVFGILGNMMWTLIQSRKTLVGLRDEVGFSTRFGILLSKRQETAGCPWFRSSGPDDHHPIFVEYMRNS
jgi:hypothetical protein